MNLGKTNLFVSYLHIISALVIAILSYLHPDKNLKFNTKLYRYQVDGIVDGSDMQDVDLTVKEEFSVSTQTLQILVVMMFCVAGFFHLFYFTNGFYTRSYLSEIRAGYNRYRWLEFSISSAIMSFILCTLAGIKDLYAVILTCVLVASICMIGFFIERSKQKSDKTVGLVAGAGIMATVLAIFYVSYFNLRAEVTDEGGENEDWVMGVLIGSGVLLVAIGILTVLYVGGYGVNDFDYVLYEKLYTYASFLAKAYLGYYTTYGILKS